MITGASKKAFMTLSSRSLSQYFSAATTNQKLSINRQSSSSSSSSSSSYSTSSSYSFLQQSTRFNNNDNSIYQRHFSTAATVKEETATTTSEDSQNSSIPYQILSISKEQWDKCIGSDNISKELQSHFDRVGVNKDRSTLLRQPTFQVIEWLNRMKSQNFIKQSKSDYAMLVDGKKGSGKSVVLSQLAFWAKQQGWFVFYIPSCYKFIHTGTLSPFPENPMLFEQNELSTEVLNRMLTVNGEMMKKINLKTKFRIQLNNFRSTPDKTLYDLASSSLEECSSEVLYHFKRELDCVTEFPVLILLDGYNHFDRVSEYGDMYDVGTNFYTLPTDRLLASNLFKPLHNHTLSNGVVVASSTDDVSKEQLLSEFEQDQTIAVNKMTFPITRNRSIFIPNVKWKCQRFMEIRFVALNPY
ncbi:hypothetical protein DFA_11031 [Cavenderia fasciculata]|uniref:Small ribosomal subunit protein mS29 n=1 Tax=Cavenderia fasciculata TaxID=261658 RepID=F4QEF7_CACFS|nr:uncharacterized protein DFA_11031 [Cavenderia fasciculata]EGG13270.1 hypothetical protein DFA_11031 [Cavenderia fasciculata]|eukprot:XP_004349969.1 hypothetical protein DFA_11031 [Cavenderia fasciculata]